jgi:hypothetical protein
MPKLIYVDIDDTIATYTDEYKGKGQYDKALPIHDRIERINRLYDGGNTIVYWTARGTMTGKNWFQITLKQLQDWGCKFHELRMNKPAYDLFIDDKNINSEVFFQ